MAQAQQQVYQKPESTEGNARSEFQRGLEELMCQHHDECMSFATCSSPRTSITEEEDDEVEQLARRGRSDLAGVDSAESSDARRHQSRILTQWAARQAQDMITTIERRNREAELIALAGLHTVSMLDSSFLQESQSPPSRRQGTVERLSTRDSSILQMWRGLEDEHALNRTHERVRGRLRQRRSLGSDTNVSSNVSESTESGNQGSPRDAIESDNNHAAWFPDQVGPQNERAELENYSREQSPDSGEVERERVRQIVRGWMESGISDPSDVVLRNESPRAEWLGETERERVRVVRELMQMTNQQRGSHSGRREERDNELGVRPEHSHLGLDSDHEGGQTEHTRTDLLRLQGRQSLIDLLVRIERERQRELQGLLEYRVVSDFAHRSRIQSLLRGRFLRNERPVEEERLPSMATGELRQLRQRLTVMGLRDGFGSRLHITDHGQEGQPTNRERNIPQLPNRLVHLDSSPADQTTNQEVAASQRDSWPEQAIEDERTNQSSRAAASNDGVQNTSEITNQNHQENSASAWPSELLVTEDGRQNRLEEDAWRADGSREAVDDWSRGPSDPPRMRTSVPFRRITRFNPSDDDNVYSMELRELISRRSVSNILHSGFRESLDLLIQSYVQRQGRAHVDWDLHQNLPHPASPVRNQHQQRDELNEDRHDATRRPSLVLPTPPVPPPRPLWHPALRHTRWGHHRIQRSEFELETINDLRADVAKIQQGMNNMQRMLEACMDMQLELQRSVRQEVSAALNRATSEQGVGEPSLNGSNWGLVKKGTCCVCCDNHIDSLLYRCGHMCICSKCAKELLRGVGKCPLCRAPIVEVIRAYSIL
ncbi:uncharacterized protein [Primulina huaijiensis]|uniref:uncharacterized protein n=1 Tax=Primulina huaijiensis TaxID=1492673 RepID=UPI003CC79900